MTVFDLYGTTDELSLAKTRIEQALNLSFDERESDYHAGVYYIHGESGGEHLLLKRNVDPVDNEPAEQSFAAYPVVMYANDLKDSQSLTAALASSYSNLSLLRHENL